MAKKRILYPLIYKTTYYSDKYFNEKLRGKPEKIKGSLIGYLPHDETEPCFDEDANIELVDNKTFEDTLTYTGYSRGRSSAVLNFEGSGGEKYDMFMTDADDLLKSKDIINQKVKGTWTYCKRGQNFGIKINTLK